MQNRIQRNFTPCMSGLRAGLLVHCEASNPESPWHNFHSNTLDWQSPDDGKDLCSHNDANFLKQANKRQNAVWINDLLAKGAEHIWVDGHKHVYLLGSPSRTVNGTFWPSLKKCNISDPKMRKDL